MTYFRLYIIKVVKGIEIHSIPFTTGTFLIPYTIWRKGVISMVDIRQFLVNRPPKGPKVYQPELLKSRTVVKDKYGMKHIVRRVKINDNAYREYYEN